MSTIYQQHDAAFRNVSAYAILDANRGWVARVAFKFPRDGAGRLYCYLHILGTRMVRGWASGGGYDKKTAAMESAVARLDTSEYPDMKATADALRKAMAGADGSDWERRLRDAGFDVLQAV